MESDDEDLLTHMESTATQDEEDGAVYCDMCEMWLNGPTQWEDHKIGKKHKKHSKPKPAPKLIIPSGTVIIKEQTATYNNAVRQYTSSLYKRGLLRSRF